MKYRILNILFALTVIAGSANGQSLSVQPIEAQTGEQAELVVNVCGIGSVTALQFNLTLPQGITLNEGAITKGETATVDHTLAVETLANGDHLFVLYSMDLNTFRDGMLLRLPITAGQQTGTFSGSLSNVRTATTDAVSYNCADATFNITVAAEEQPVTYQIVFNANNGEGNMADMTLTYDQAQTLTENAFTRTGYTFEGWNTAADGSGDSYADKASVKNLTAENNATVTMYAQWKAITYTITYDLAGGSVATANPTEYNVETATFTLTNPTREGYNFTGWTGTDLTEPTETVTIAQGSMGDREYTATWEVAYILGDINGDGTVDVSDYIGVANHIMGQSPVGFNEMAGDVDANGIIDVSDYIGVANIILTGNVNGTQQSRATRHENQSKYVRVPDTLGREGSDSFIRFNQAISVRLDGRRDSFYRVNDSSYGMK